jgi:hypothetical protein
MIRLDAKTRLSGDASDLAGRRVQSGDPAPADDLNAGIGPEKILTRYRGYSSSHWIEKH